MRVTLAQIADKRQAIDTRRITVASYTPDKTRLSAALAAAQSPIVIETSEDLEATAQSWTEATRLGLDTEFVRERTYRADLGLVQVSDGKTAWLIDPVAVEDMRPLQDFLRDKSTPKVIHSGSEDFEVIHHQLGVLPQAVLDSQIGCAMLGQSLQLGYHHMVEWLLGVEIDKDHTRSNWMKRPLSSGQMRYAALDVVLLPLVMEQLGEKLEKLGRLPWLQEEVARTARKSIQEVDPQEAWQRVRGAGNLNDRERTVLSMLAAWREGTAKSKNIARGFVVSDAALLAMSRMNPSSPSDFGQIEHLHPRSIERHGKIWFEIIQHAQDEPITPPLFQLNNQQRTWLQAMKRLVAKAAAQLNVDAALLASRKQLESLICSFVTRDEVPGRFLGWRSEVITEKLLAVMRQ